MLLNLYKNRIKLRKYLHWISKRDNIINMDIEKEKLNNARTNRTPNEKAENGEGHISYAPSTKSWRYKIQLPDGTTKQFSSKISKKALKQKIKAWEEKGKIIEEKSFNNLIDDWKKWYLKNDGKNNRPYSTEKKWRTIDKYIKSYFGNRKANHITTKNIISWQNKYYEIAEKRGKGISPINDALGIIKNILTYGVLIEAVDKNVAFHIPKLHINRKESFSLTKSQIDDVMKAIDLEENPVNRAYIKILILGGDRMSEISALNVSDYDIKNKTIDIHKIKSKQHGIQPHAKRNSDRIKKLIPEAIKVMENYLSEKMLDENPLIAKSEILFPNKWGNHINYDNFKKHIWKRVIKNSGVPAETTIHIMRHSFVTNMLEENDLYKVSKYIGHKDIKTTQQYYNHDSDRIKSLD